MRDTVSRFHFINLVKVTKDFLGEHCSPLTENDCTMLCEKTNLIDEINQSLISSGITGLKVQLNWSEDNGSTWVQYPKSH